MKLELDPMPVLREARIRAINRNFSFVSSENVHRDLAHAMKRVQAQAVLDGGTPAPEFEAEAHLRGIDPRELATIILSKPNDLAARELRRQKLMKAVGEATTPEELEVLSKVLED